MRLEYFAHVLPNLLHSNGPLPAGLFQAYHEYAKRAHFEALLILASHINSSQPESPEFLASRDPIVL